MVVDKDLAEILERIEMKVDALTEAVEALQGKGAKLVGGEGNVKPSDKKFEEKMDEMPDQSGRIKCPKCGSLKVTQMKDMKKVLSYSGGIPIYATKHVCNQCSNEW